MVLKLPLAREVMELMKLHLGQPLLGPDTSLSHRVKAQIFDVDAALRMSL